MIELIVGATTGSNISNAQIIMEGPGYTVNLNVSAGIVVRGVAGSPLQGPDVGIRLAVASRDRLVQMYVENIPSDSTVIVTGINEDEFHANIYHSHLQGHTAPTCELRCIPSQQPTLGPGCRTCSEHGLRFKVCC